MAGGAVRGPASSTGSVAASTGSAASSTGSVAASTGSGASTGSAALPATAGTTPRAGVGPLTFGRLKWVSFTHSCIYASLLLCAFAAGKPEPLTFVLGMSHGLLWIAMSLTCVGCARLRIVSFRLAVAVAVLGGVGPFFGSYEFVREQQRRAR